MGNASQRPAESGQSRDRFRFEEHDLVRYAGDDHVVLSWGSHVYYVGQWTIEGIKYAAVTNNSEREQIRIVPLVTLGRTYAELDPPRGSSVVSEFELRALMAVLALEVPSIDGRTFAWEADDEDGDLDIDVTYGTHVNRWRVVMHDSGALTATYVGEAL